MAALDYGMALSRGLIAPQKELQTQIKELAGASFKSEDWWNKQLDRQIQEGYKQTDRVSATFFNGRGTFDVKVKGKGYESATPITEERYARRGRAGGPQYLPITTPNVDPRFYTKRSFITGYDAVKQVNLSSAQLGDIQKQAEQNIANVKRDARLEKSKTKRGARGSSGLLGKSTLQDKGLSAKLPELGSMGLGIEKTYLG